MTAASPFLEDGIRPVMPACRACRPSPSCPSRSSGSGPSAPRCSLTAAGLIVGGIDGLGRVLERGRVVRALVRARCRAVRIVQKGPELVVDEFRSIIEGIQGAPMARGSRGVGVPAAAHDDRRPDRHGPDDRGGREAGYLNGPVTYDDIVAPSAAAPCAAG